MAVAEVVVVAAPLVVVVAAPLVVVDATVVEVVASVVGSSCPTSRSWSSPSRPVRWEPGPSWWPALSIPSWAESEER